MNERLSQFISYKTGGNQKEFAALLGWSPQYLHKMLKGDSMGIQPVITLLQTFPELNARWLILGEGFMFDIRSNIIHMIDIRRNIMHMIELEKFIPVMNREELAELEGGKTDFDEATRMRWQEMLDKRQREVASRFEAAYKKQQEKPANNLQVGKEESTNS